MGVLDAVDRGQRAVCDRQDEDGHRDSIRDSTSRAIAAGVKVAMGTDSGITSHGQNLRELEQMVACGMSPAQAVIATRRTAAHLMGLADDRGLLEPGKGRRGDRPRIALRAGRTAAASGGWCKPARWWSPCRDDPAPMFVLKPGNSQPQPTAPQPLRKRWD